MSRPQIDVDHYGRHIGALRRTYISMLEHPESTISAERRKFLQGIVEGLKLSEEVIFEHIAIENHYEKMPVALERNSHAVGFPNS